MAEQVKSRIDIEVNTKGAKEAAVLLDKVVTANDDLTISVDKSAKIRERSEASVERLARQLDREYDAVRRAEQAQRTLDRAYAAGLAGTQAYERALAVVNRSHNDNARSTGLARYELINLGRQFQDVGVSLAGGQSPFTVLAQQGTQIADIFTSARGGPGAALRGFAGQLAGIVTPARLGFAGVIAAAAGAAFEIAKANSALESFGQAARKTGIAPSRIAGAEIVGARAGLGQDETRAALETANKQFEQFKRDSGDVKDFLEKQGKGFIDASDKARSFAEWLDTITNKIRALPRDEAADLAQKAFGSDFGTRAFENIRNGEFAMSALRDAAEKAGVAFIDGPARAAEEMQRRIDESAKIADTKLLGAFGALAHPLDSVVLKWQEIKGSIADAVITARAFVAQMQNAFAINSGLPKLPGAVGESITDYERRLGLMDTRPGIAPSPDFAGARSAFFARGPQVAATTAGASRARYEARADAAKAHRAGGKSDTERAVEQYEKISRELDNQLSLAASIGAEHDKIALKIEIENKQLQLGTGATEKQKDHIAEMVTKIDEAKKAQDRLNESAQKFNEAYRDVANTFAGGIKDILKGGKPGDALKRVNESLSDSMLDAALTGSGPLASILGLAGKNGAPGGLFGMLGGALGLGNTQQMRVQAGTVFVNGSVAGLGGEGGGLFGGLGGLLGGGGGGIFGSLFSGLFNGPFGLPSFAAGGIMTSAGPIPLRRYAGGGVANSAQLALFGEGSTPEAFVPVPSGRIPVEMRGQPQAQAPAVTVHNYSGVDVEPRITRGEIDIMIGKRLSQNNARTPGMLSAYEKAKP